MNILKNRTVKVGVIGLGYVGLPLALEFGKKYETVGFDISSMRVAELAARIDSTLECSPEDFSAASLLSFSDDVNDIKLCNVYIVTVPTPIDKHNRPDLSPLINASSMLGKILKKEDVVVYESTVYPGATLDECVPLLERYSNLKLNDDFYVGYSPERINPGDKTRRLTTIKKITSGSTEESSLFIDSLYGSIIDAGTYRAPSIVVAEAAKVIENTQRDLNIALMNELSLIFNKMGIDTKAVLDAAGTKWNFLPFTPGLVGGHCIGVDPYYLTHKAQAMGYHPEVILAGRRINDKMPFYVAADLVKFMLSKQIAVGGSNILVMGITFKENCPDLRNSKVVDLVNELKGYNVHVDVYDPWVTPSDALAEYSIELTTELKRNYYDAVVLAVAHDEFKELDRSVLQQHLKKNSVVYDLKSTMDITDSDIRL